jgi:hypothetical protein
MSLNGEQPLVAELKEGAVNVVGRAAESDIVLDDPTVSRRHVTLRLENDVFVLENVSQSNVARVNGAAIDRPVPLSDLDRVGLGNVELTFHDLKSGDRLSGPICSHCSRENMPSDKDCWYCGTSLVNAPTSILNAKKVVCRLVDAAGQVWQVHPGEVFVIVPGGEAWIAREDDLPHNLALAVKPADGKPGAYLFAHSATCRVNGAGPESRQALHTGDQIEAEEKLFWLVVR